MAWNNPTWKAESITVEKLNTRLRDNMTALKEPPTDYYHYSYTGASFATTTSTSFAVISANLSLSLTTTGGDVLLVFNAAASNCYLDFTVDDERLGGTDGILAIPTLATYGEQTQMIWLAQNLAAGDHTFEVHWKVASGTGTLYQFVPPSFFAREVS